MFFSESNLDSTFDSLKKRSSRLEDVEKIRMYVCYHMIILTTRGRFVSLMVLFSAVLQLPSIQQGAIMYGRGRV